jgi:hypothetical protein
LHHCLASGDSSSVAELSARFLRQLRASRVKGLELLEHVDYLISVQTRAVHDTLKRELLPVVHDAELELWRLVPRRPGLPSTAILSSFSALTSVATPAISRERGPNLSSSRDALQQLHRLQYALEEARFELVARYISHLSADALLPDKIVDTMRQTMSSLPDRPAHRLIQVSIIDSLRDLIQRDDSMAIHGAMEPVIDVVLGIIRYLSDTESIQRARELIQTYKQTSRHNKAAYDALGSLQNVPADVVTSEPSTSSAIAPRFVDSPTGWNALRTSNDPPTVDAGLLPPVATSSSAVHIHHASNLPTPPV